METGVLEMPVVASPLLQGTKTLHEPGPAIKMAQMTLSPAAHITTSSPGRICLFGEHQDYLRLPVIAMAIDLRIEVRGTRRADGLMRVNLPDIGQVLEFDPNVEFAYRHGRDYLPAAANVLRRLTGVRWTVGYDAEVRSRVPINSGASSSSALQVAWTAFLLAAAGDERANDPEFVAKWAQYSEVPEFGSPGGVMDHYSSALGGVVFLDCLEPCGWEQLSGELGPFVLIDSGTPKATNEVLASVRAAVENGMRACGLEPGGDPDLLAALDPAQIPALADATQDRMLRAALRNRDLTREAKLVFAAGTRADPRQIGLLLDAHHAQLARGLGISTPLIDDLLSRARAAGALGGKINGSGGGGSCFALCPANAESVAQAIRDGGFRAEVVRCGPGLRVEAR
jgi:galactokinase